MTAEADVAKLGNLPGLENAMETHINEIADGIGSVRSRATAHGR
jgi:hypothetical protein